MIDSCEGYVRHEGVEAANAADAEPVEHEADRVQPAERRHVLDDEREGVPRRLAEPVVGEGDLNVGVLRDKLDALLEQPEQIARVAEQALDAGVLVGSLDLFAVVLEEEAYELADGDQGGAERD